MNPSSRFSRSAGAVSIGRQRRGSRVNDKGRMIRFRISSQLCKTRLIAAILCLRHCGRPRFSMGEPVGLPLQFIWCQRPNFEACPDPSSRRCSASEDKLPPDCPGHIMDVLKSIGESAADYFAELVRNSSCGANRKCLEVTVIGAGGVGFELGAQPAACGLCCAHPDARPAASDRFSGGRRGMVGRGSFGAATVLGGCFARAFSRAGATSR